MKRLLPIALVALVVVPLLAFGLYPMLVVLAQATRGLEALTEPASREALWATLVLSGGATLLALLLGAPAAFALARCAVPGARTLRTLLTLPSVVPPYLMGIAWLDLANPKNGLLNVLAGATWVDIYTQLGIVWVLGLCFFPFVMLPVLTTLERMDASLEESARLAGAGPWRVLRDITLPLAVPSIAAGAVLVFLAAAATFGVPYLLGTAGPQRIRVLTTAIVDHITVGGESHLSQAMALSAALLVVSAAVTLLGGLASRGERKYAIVSGKGARARPLVLSPQARRAVAGALWAVVFVAVLLPLGTLLLVSILRAWGAGFGPDNWSLDNYRRVLFENRHTLPSLANSLGLATAAGLIAVVVGTLIAYLSSRKPGLATRALSALAHAPYAVPGTVIALGLILGWSRELRVIVLERLTLSLDLFSGLWALLAAYVVKYLAFGVRLAGSGLLQIDRALEEAARTSGATRLAAAVDVVVPLLWPSLGAAWLLVFLPTLSEITMSILLVGPGTPVVGTVLFELQSYADPPSAAVLAVLLVALTLLGNAVLRRLTGGRGGF